MALVWLVPDVASGRKACIMHLFQPGSIMADILVFPTDATTDVSSEQDVASEQSDDHFLLDEGLELLSDFRSIEDRQVRDAVRSLVKTLALASRKVVASGR